MLIVFTTAGVYVGLTPRSFPLAAPDAEPLGPRRSERFVRAAEDRGRPRAVAMGEGRDPGLARRRHSA